MYFNYKLQVQKSRQSIVIWKTHICLNNVISPVILIVQSKTSYSHKAHQNPCIIIKLPFRKYNFLRTGPFITRNDNVQVLTVRTFTMQCLH